MYVEGVRVLNALVKKRALSITTAGENDYALIKDSRVRAISLPERG
ncbi:MAG: hypothetical protein ACI915_000488 [Gammaproteobacteria bacterium]|jgi:hypothetical protein